MGKSYFPEITASATIVNAPWIFAKIYGVVSPLLTEVMRRKVCILDEKFGPGLEAHCGLRQDDLPEFLGGKVPDSQCPLPLPVPRGAGAQARALRLDQERHCSSSSSAIGAEEEKCIDQVTSLPREKGAR